MSKSSRWILPAFLLAAAPAVAQFGQLGGPGEIPQTAKERVMASYQSAPWRLGPLQLEPRLAISDIGYVSNIYFSADDQQSDLKATGSAGIRGFLNLGPKLLISPFADLSYSWWRDQDDLRSTNESYGAEIFGDFNRLQLQLQAGQVAAQRNLSREVQVPVDQEIDRLEFGFDVDFWGPLRLFGTVAENRTRYTGRTAEQQVPGLNLAALESDGEQLRVGLNYDLTGAVRIGLGFERTESTFLVDPNGRTNRGTGPLLRISFEGTRLSLDLDAARKELELVGRPDSKRRQLNGQVRLGWKFTEKLTSALYSDRQLSYSALDTNAIFDSSRVGLSLQRRGGPRIRTGVFYEAGRDEFATVADDRVTRVDDTRTFGASIELQLSPRLVLNLRYVDSQRDSSDPLFNRSSRALVSRIGLAGNLLPW